MLTRRRAYILLETLVAGGIVSISLATSVTMIASSRFETSMAGKRAEASSLALGIADSLMTATTAEEQPLADVPGHPSFKASYTVTDANLQSLSTPALPSSDTLHLIRVTVQFPSSRGPQQVVYERLRRRLP